MTIATVSKPYKRDEVRCGCGKKLGDLRDGSLIIIRSGLGHLIVKGGWHLWTCQQCGITQDIDLTSA